MRSERYAPTREKQYIRKLGNRGMKKYIKTAEWNEAADLVEERESLGKPTQLIIGGRPVSKRRQKKALGRENVKKRHTGSLDASSVITREIVALSPPECTAAMQCLTPGVSLGLETHIGGYLVSFENLAFFKYISSFETFSTFNTVPLGAFDQISDSTSTTLSMPKDLVKSIKLPDIIEVIAESQLGKKQTNDIVLSLPWLRSLHWIIYMSSNALLSEDALGLVGDWIEKAKIFHYIKPFLKLGGLSSEIFASNLLLDAVKRCKKHRVQMLLAAGVPVNMQPNEVTLTSLLDIAVKVADHQMVKVLLENGADPHYPLGRKISVLERLAVEDVWQGHTFTEERLQSRLLIIKSLILAGTPVSNLFVAMASNTLAEVGDVSKSALFEVLGISPLPGPSENVSWQLQYALSFSNIPLLESLLCMRLDINCLYYLGMPRDKRWMPATPISIAVSKNNYEMVRILLEKGADPNMKVTGRYMNLANRSSSFPIRASKAALDCCKKGTDAAIIGILMKHGASGTYKPTTWKDHNQESLFDAVEKQNESLLCSLINKGVNLNTPRPFDQMTVLRLAIPWKTVGRIRIGELAVAKILLDHGADVNHRLSPDDSSLLDLAIDANDPTLVRLFLEYGANIREFGGYNSGFLYYKRMLYDFYQCAEIILMLIEHGVDVNACKPGQLTLIQVAVWIESYALVSILLENGADPTKFCRSAGFPPLHTALKADDPATTVKMLDALVYLGADINAYQLVKLEGYSLAALGLGQNGLSWGKNSPELMAEMTPLQMAAWLGCGPRTIKAILKKGGDINASPKGPAGFTPLQGAIVAQHYQTARDLIIFGAAINSPAAPEVGYTALQAAILVKEDQLAIELLEKNADVNAPAPSIGGSTALQAAVFTQNMFLVDWLLEAGANVNAPPSSCLGKTALQAAVMRKNSRLVKVLLDHGADINAPACEEGGGTALQFAAISGDMDLTIQLIKHGADIYARPSYNCGRTPLQGAAEHGRLDLVLMFLGNGWTLGRSDCKKAAALAGREKHPAIARAIRSKLVEFVDEDDYYVTTDSESYTETSDEEGYTDYSDQED